MITLDDYIDSDSDDVVDTNDRDFHNGGNPPEPGDGDDASDFELDDDPRKGPEPTGDPEPADPGVDDDIASGVDSDNGDFILKFLERYNIVGGMIDTSKGEVEFSSLSDEDKLKALEQIVDSTRPSIEDEYGLSEEELILLNSIRKSQMGVNDFLYKISQDIRTDEYVDSMFSTPEYRFEDMSNEDIYKAYLMANSPEATEETIGQELEYAKKSAIFDKTAETLRNSFISNRESQKQELLDKQNEARVQEAKSSVGKYIGAAKKVNEIDGWPVSDEVKNNVLESLVEVDQVGKSKFIREVVEDPENAFKAMWYLQNGAEYFERLDTYYKGELKKVYEKGIQDGKAGKSYTPGRVSGVKSTSGGGKDQDQLDLETFLNS